MIYILDTDIVTLAEYGHSRVMQSMTAIASTDTVAVSIITHIEVLTGRLEAVKKAATGHDVLRMQERLVQSQQHLAQFRLIPVDHHAADLFDQFRTSKKQPKINRGDLLIACIALANRATVVTRNTRDFANVPGIQLEDWSA